MRSKSTNLILLLSVGLLALFANCGVVVYFYPTFLTILVACVAGISALPMLAQAAPMGRQLWFLTHGNYCLKIFFCSTVLSVIFQVFLGLMIAAQYPLLYLVNLLICFGVLAVFFYIGIVIVYCTSSQLGLKLRIWGVCLGMIPLVNIIGLVMILQETDREILFEKEKELLNQRRKNRQICKTKYPILLVHGVFFRDFKYFGYWGRIPGQLRRNGASVYFGNQPSADSIGNCAKILTERIQQIIHETGCEKVNIIAHSKGGLDCRYALAFCGAAPYVASLTTVSTPHRGSEFADYMLTRVSAKNQHRFCSAYNKTLNKLGEPEADLMTAVRELTTEHCTALDKRMHQPEGILCQSFGSKMNKPLKGRFPMNFTGVVMGYLAQDNDGIVGADSFPWGDRYTLLTSDSPVGISHCDMTDLNRTNLPDFDIREFYVQLVAELKEKGL